MKYKSTRDFRVSVTSAEAIVKGLSEDGGLFLPESIPSVDIAPLVNLSYRERAKAVFSYFLTDFTADEIADAVDKAYTKESFGTEQIAPLRKLDESRYVLELWHGPTCAFKDMALQILPHLLTTAAKKTGMDKEIVILVATSGDTGKAALDGFADVAGTKIIVFYPQNGVSRIQKLQMCTQRGENVYVAAVDGNFDDAQSGVKAIFTDKAYGMRLSEAQYVLSSANSINWGRLLPQIVYYISAYCDMVRTGEIRCGEAVNVCVPTGNFGNILAAYYAKRMSLPIKKLICASNRNKVLTDFFASGTYDKNRDFYTTVSPSMDILISSNLERLLYLLTDGMSGEVAEYMKSLSKNGKYTVSKALHERIKAEFAGGYNDDEECKKTISETAAKYGYIIDTHTAVAMGVYTSYASAAQDDTKTIIASTANPFKFNEAVLSALCGDAATQGKDEFEMIDALSEKFSLDVPQPLRELKTLPVRFDDTFEKGAMRSAVSGFLGI
ncbi:MAG: threonine synthase [Clostridia bacterium]|nr:threonine synthase [Clostridia bacterium]